MLAMTRTYLRAAKMFADFENEQHFEKIEYSQVLELDLSTVRPCISGPKRPHDKILLSDVKTDFLSGLEEKVSFKGFGLSAEKAKTQVEIEIEGEKVALGHGSVVLAAITSCTNTSNPSVMLAAALLAKKAVEKGLKVSKSIKTSLSPGSGVVTKYLEQSGLLPYLQQLGFHLAGYGCMTCIGNSGPLVQQVAEAVEKHDLIVAGVLSGNRNFEGRIHAQVRANYLASPPLVVAYALAATLDVDFDTQPLGRDENGQCVYLREIWPSRNEVAELEQRFVLPAFFKQVYASVDSGSTEWQALECPQTLRYPWDPSSTYIKRVPFFENMKKEPTPKGDIVEAYVLLNLGDSVTTDHISPAGSISRTSPAAKYLGDRGLTPKEFNTYGSRRGNDEVMARGTFANIRLVNKFMSGPGAKTLYIPTGEQMSVYDAAMRYKDDGHTVIILAGKEYGSGSSRDWAAKGPYLQNVRAVLAESFERIHRSNLIGMGIVPLEYKSGETAESLGLTAKERFTITIPPYLKPGQNLTVELDSGRKFEVLCRFDTEVELTYYRHGGILQYMIRKLL